MLCAIIADQIFALFQVWNAVLMLAPFWDLDCKPSIFTLLPIKAEP
jgi:hypothetical protein